MKYIIGIVGVIITLCSFVIDNAQYFSFLYPIMVPSYTNAMIAYDKIYKQGFILKEGDIGFKEISEVVKADIRTASGDTPPPVIITQIRAIKFGRTRVFPPESPAYETDFIELEVSLQNYPSTKGNIRSFKEKIEGTYLTKTIFKWKVAALAVGITMTLISIFL